MDLFIKIINQLDIKKQCKKFHLPLYQCQHFLFIVMGILIIATILSTYFIGLKYIDDPLLIALIVMVLAVFLLLIAFLINNSFEKVAEAAQLKTEFINIVSHQLKTPVLNLNWAADILFSRDKEIAPEKKNEFIEIIRENIKRMRELLNELVMVSKIENGRHTLSLETVNILDLFNTVISFFKPCATKKNVAINFYSEGDFPKKIKIDPLKLKVIIENLVENAVRYTNSGGKIDIFLKIIPNEKIIFKISDTGIGIKKDDYKIIFKKFCRSEEAQKIKTQGLGLGLYIVKTYTEQLGGKVSFYSEYQKGTTFILEFPVVFK